MLRCESGPRRTRVLLCNELASRGGTSVKKVLKAILGVVVTIGIVVIAGGTGRLGARRALDGVSSSVAEALPDSIQMERQLRATAREMNAEGSKLIDAGTRLDSVSAGPGHQLTYYYSLVNQDADDVDSAAFAQFAQSTLVPSACRTTAYLLQRGVRVNYWYLDRSGTGAAKHSVTKEDCPAGR